MHSRSWWFPAFAVVVGVVPCVAQESPPAAVVVPPLEFAWPLPAKAVVVKDGAKKGNEAKLRFQLAVANDTADELRARMTKFEFLEIGGRDATTAEMQKVLEPALALTQAVPDIVIDAKGAYRRIDGLEAMMERVEEFESRRRQLTDAQREEKKRALESPAMRDALQQACSADWNTWVGAWIGFDLAPGTQRSDRIETTFFDTTIRSEVTRRHHGPAADVPGHVRLTSVAVAEGQEAVEAYRDILRRVAQESGGKPFPVADLEAVRQELQLEVITDPRTLLPRRAIRTKTIRIVMAGETRDQVERADYTFEWEKAAPAGR